MLSFQNTVMIAMGKSIIFNEAKMLSLRILLVMEQEGDVWHC